MDGCMYVCIHRYRCSYRYKYRQKYHTYRYQYGYGSPKDAPRGSRSRRTVVLQLALAHCQDLFCYKTLFRSRRSRHKHKKRRCLVHVGGCWRWLCGEILSVGTLQHGAVQDLSAPVSKLTHQSRGSSSFLVPGGATVEDGGDTQARKGSSSLCRSVPQFHRTV